LQKEERLTDRLLRHKFVLTVKERFSTLVSSVFHQIKTIEELDEQFNEFLQAVNEGRESEIRTIDSNGVWAASVRFKYYSAIFEHTLRLVRTVERLEDVPLYLHRFPISPK
jgi:hypothetical protein